jgi:dipeptidase
MTRLTIEMPDPLHKVIKSLAIMKGDSIKNITIEALTNYAKSSAGIVASSKTSKSGFTEEEAEKMLIPYFKKMIESIESGSKKFYTKEEYMKEINKDDKN